MTAALKNLVLPRFPNLLVNGSSGSPSDGQNIPAQSAKSPPPSVVPENRGHLRSSGAAMLRVKGPDFPTAAQILGTKGSRGLPHRRGSITMRAVIEMEEIQGRNCLVITELLPGR